MFCAVSEAIASQTMKRYQDFLAQEPNPTGLLESYESGDDSRVCERQLCRVCRKNTGKACRPLRASELSYGETSEVWAARLVMCVRVFTAVFFAVHAKLNPSGEGKLDQRTTEACSSLATVLMNCQRFESIVSELAESQYGMHV